MKTIKIGIEHFFELPEGYQFTDENGNVINATKIVLEKKEPEWPKSYDDCVIYNREGTSYNRAIRLSKLEKLLFCRDVYWKLAGDWKPDYDSGVDKFGIICYNGVISKTGAMSHWERHSNKILDFPTIEMRDVFFENFKDLIEGCKELL